MILRTSHGGVILQVALVLLAAAAFGAEPPDASPAPDPNRPTLIDEDGLNIKLKGPALRSTLAAIRDGSLGVEKRIDAIALAGMAHLKEAVPALADVLKQDDRAEVKVAAIWALREIGDPGAVPILLMVHGQAAGPNPVLRYDEKISFPDVGTEMTLLELIEDSIGHLGAPVLGRYLDLLNIASGSYRSEDQRAIGRQRSALAVVVCVGDRDHRAVEAMRRILESPVESYPADFRENAAYGLARVLVSRSREFAAVQAEDKSGEEIAELLVEYAVGIEPSPAREYIAGALSLARPERAVTLLTEHFADNSSEEVRMRVIEVLGLLRSRESIEALAWALEREENPELRWRAAFGLGLCGESETSLDALKKALEDESPRVRQVAIEAVGRLGGKVGVEIVAPAAGDPDAKTRAAAARAFALSGDKAAVEHLLVLAKDEDTLVRATAVAALGAFPVRDSLAAIVNAASDDARQVRFAAVKVLSQIPAPAAYKALFTLVGDPDRVIKQDAMFALQIGREHHADAFKKALINVINDPENPAGADACEFADFPKDTAVVEALQKAAFDTRPAVRAAAIRMLHKMGLK